MYRDTSSVDYAPRELTHVMDYPGLLCHTLEMHYVLLTYNLRLKYLYMLESICLALESGVHGINM